MIDLERELSGWLPDRAPTSGALDQTRAAGRRRHRRRRTGVTLLAMAIVIVVLAGTWVARSESSKTVATGPGIGLDAPTTLVVTCTAGGPVLSSDIVQVGADGFTVEYHNPTNVTTNVSIGSDAIGAGSAGHGLEPRQVMTAVETTAPGSATVECGQDRASTSSVEVTLADPHRYYGASTVLECGGAGQAIVDMGPGNPVSNPDDALRPLLTPDVQSDHDLVPAGYPSTVPRSYAVRHGDRSVAIAGFKPAPNGVVLVELNICADALEHH